MTHADAIAMEERGAVHHERTSSGGALDSSVTHPGNPIVGFQPVAPVGSSSARGGSGHDWAESQAVSGLAGLRVTNGGGSSGGALETIDQSPQIRGERGRVRRGACRAEARREVLEMFIGSHRPNRVRSPSTAAAGDRDRPRRHRVAPGVDEFGGTNREEELQPTWWAHGGCDRTRNRRVTSSNTTYFFRIKPPTGGF